MDTIIKLLVAYCEFQYKTNITLRPTYITYDYLKLNKMLFLYL